MKRSLQEIAELLQARLVGNGEVEIRGVSSLRSASPGDLVFVEEEKSLSAAIHSQASAVIAGEFASQGSHPKPLLIVAQPKLAFSRAARLLSPLAQQKSGVHLSAVVAASAKLAESIVVEAGAVIGENARVGAGTRVGAGSVIGDAVVIGENCQVYPRVVIYPGVIVGDRVIIHSGAVLGSDGFGYVRDQASGRYEKFPQIGKLRIEADVEIGANAAIDRGALEVTRIRRGAKIDNLVHIGHNCDIGEDVVIAAQTGLSGSIVIEKDAVLGGQVGIGEHARIEEGVMIGGQGGVLPNKVLRGKGIVFWGTPAHPVRAYLKQLAALARLAKKD